MKNLINKSTGIDTNAIYNLFSVYLNDIYNLMTAFLGAILVVVIGVQSYKYLTMVDEEERSWKEWFKKVGKSIFIGIFLMLLPQIIKAFGI